MRIVKTALIAASVVALSGCAQIAKIPGFQPRGDLLYHEPGTVRLDLTPPDQQLIPTPALQGVGFNLPAPTVMANWPLPGGTPEQAVEHLAAAPAFEIAWVRKIGKKSTNAQFITAPPIAVGGRIYTMDATARITAVSAESGAPLWSVQLAPQATLEDYLPDVKLPFAKGRVYEDLKAFGGGLAYDAGRIYVTSGYRFVVALDAATGAEVWRTPVKSPIHAAPTVGNGRVFVVNTNNELQSFNAASGTPGWQYQGLVEQARILLSSSPAITGDTVIASFASGELSALQASNGSELWTGNLIQGSRTTALSEIRDISGRPVVYKGDVFAGGHSGAFGAVDLRTGQPRWQLPIVTVSSPWAAGDVVYAVSKTGQVICISRQTGQIYWITDLNSFMSANDQRSGFLGLGNNLNGRVYWTGVMLASNRLITVSSSGFATALDPKTGSVIKTIKLGAPALIAPMAAGGMVYVMLDNGRLVAIR